MTFQALDLMMAGLVVTHEPNDRTPSLTPPPLAPGVHLRWAFSPEIGFPWGGYHLFRREHQEAEIKLLVAPSEPAGTSLGSDSAVVLLPPGLGGKPPLSVHIKSDRPVDVQPSPHGGPEKGYGLTGRTRLRFDLHPRENPAYKAVVKLITVRNELVRVLALFGDATVAVGELAGGAGPAEVTVEFDAITGIEIRGAEPDLPLPPGIVVEIVFFELVEALNVLAEPSAWTALTKEPIRLPVSHPSYPCTPGTPFDVARERSRARSLVRYGDPDDIVPSGPSATGAGTVQLHPGSPLVLGKDTAFGPDDAGKLLEVDGDADVYGIIQVLGPTKLVLTRPYEGPGASAARYRVAQDTFGLYYDQCQCLVRQGASGPPMAYAAAPPPIPATGTLSFQHGYEVARGESTSFTADHVGLSLHVVAAQEGTLTLEPGLRTAVGDAAAAAAWSTRFVAGTRLYIEGAPTPYHVIGWSSAAKALWLDAPYSGRRVVSKVRYRLVEPAEYRITAVTGGSPQSVVLDRPYERAARDRAAYLLTAPLRSASPGDGKAPQMPIQRPLDVALLASLHPAAAQILGLYHVDDLAGLSPTARYDYVLIADQEGKYNNDPATALADFLKAVQGRRLAAIHGCAVMNRGLDQPYVGLRPPEDSTVRVYDLPGSSLKPGASGEAADCNAGLVWGLSEPGFGALLPGRSVMYHVWRARLGETLPVEAPRPGDFELLGREPILVAGEHIPHGTRPPRPPRWPARPLHAIDRGLDQGYYSYRVHGVDVFGRHSAPSAPAIWSQWTPPPSPTPWYYKSDAGDGAVAQPGAAYAIRLLDQVPPPSPAAVEAWALDPEDPTTQRDAAYAAWYASLSDEERKDEARKNIGLRLRFAWTKENRLQAPDTKEFRVYYRSGHLNSLRGRALVVHAGADESIIETDIAPPATPAMDAYVGASLLIGGLAYRVVGSDAGAPLRLRVRNAGASYAKGRVLVAADAAVVKGTPDVDWRPDMAGSRIRITTPGETTEYTILVVRGKDDLLLATKFIGTPTRAGTSDEYVILPAPPPAGAACTLSLVPIHTSGRVSVRHGSNEVTGAEAGLNLSLVDCALTVHGDGTEYRVARVDAAADKLWLDRPYEGPTATAAPYVIRNKFAVDYSRPESWEARILVIRFDEHFKELDGGHRLYEVFMPAAGELERAWLPLRPTAEDPIAYGAIGVSAVDDKAHATDDPRWTGTRLGDRTGNEGQVAAPARVFRVHRQPPDPPSVPQAPPRVFATPADVELRSFTTFRFHGRANLRAHIVRALDETVFLVDWARRSKERKAVSPTDKAFAPEFEMTDRTRQDVAAAINALNDAARFPAGDPDTALAHYRTLEDDALRVLANLAGNEGAFSQVTARPLDRAEMHDRKGPDDPPGYVPQPDLCAFVDTLDGASTNRYFYRALFVDGASNRSGLSAVGPPVYLPNVVPPRAPVLTKLVASSDREITVTWQASLEADVAEYHVYRAESAEEARDVRRMVRAGTRARPADGSNEVAFVDREVRGARTYFYRVCAEDTAGNVSAASEPLSARAYDQTPPKQHASFTGSWRDDGSGIGLAWTADPANPSVETMVLKRSSLGNWVAISPWLAPGVKSIVDLYAAPGAPADYRVWVRSEAGVANKQAKQIRVEARSGGG
ncbi:hypothetical protein WMF30_22240 [Sorangium sp. So ce134]